MLLSLVTDTDRVVRVYQSDCGLLYHVQHGIGAGVQPIFTCSRWLVLCLVARIPTLQLHHGTGFSLGEQLSEQNSDIISKRGLTIGA